MTDLGTGIIRSIEILWVAIIQQRQQANSPMNQNVFYQHPGYPSQSFMIQPLMSNDDPFSQMMNLYQGQQSKQKNELSTGDYYFKQ